MSKVLWPEHEDLLSLMTLRLSIGTAAFNSEKQSDPLDPSLCEFDPAWFLHPLFWFDDWPEGLILRVLCLDASLGGSDRTSDFQAFVKLGMTADSLLWVEADLRKQTMPAMVDTGVQIIRDFKPHAFGTEANTFQSLIRSEFDRALAAAKIVVPVCGLINTVNKSVRIRRLSPYLSQRRMRFKRRSAGTEELVRQLQAFPHGAHDDGPDSLDGALRVGKFVQTGNLEA